METYLVLCPLFFSRTPLRYIDMLHLSTVPVLRNIQTAITASVFGHIGFPIQAGADDITGPFHGHRMPAGRDSTCTRIALGL